MKKLFLILTLMVTYYGTTQVNLDSLWGIWNNPNEPDTSKLKAMREISWSGYLFTWPDSAFYFAQLQYNLAEEKGEKDYMANALNTQGVSYTIRGDYARAIDCHTHSLRISEELEDAPGAAASLNNIASVYYHQGDYTNTLEYLGHSLKVQEEMGDSLAVSAALNNIGNVYNEQGNYSKAIDYYTRSLKTQEEMGDKQSTATTLNNIGNVYENQGDYARAIDHFIRSLKIREEIGDSLGVSLVLSGIANIYASQGDYIRALEYETHSLKIAEEMGDKNGVSTSLNSIGIIYHNLNDHARAIDYYNRSLKMSEELGDKSGKAFALISIGTLYNEQGDYTLAIECYVQSLMISKEIGDQNGIALALATSGDTYYLQGNYKKALENGEKALAIAQEINEVYVIKIASRLLWDVHKKLDNHKPALEMHELYIATRDSMESEENQKEIIRQEYKYAYEKQAVADSIKTAEANKLKDAQLQAAKAKTAQREQQQYFLYAGLAMTLLFGGIVFNRFRVTSKQKLKNLELEKQISAEKLKLATENIREKLETIETLTDKLQSKSVESEKYRMERISTLFSEINYLDEPKWNEVIHHYDRVHDNFSQKIMQKFDKITREDVKLLILVKMGFLNKEISAIRGTAVDSTKKAKQRLRIKLGIKDLNNV